MVTTAAAMVFLEPTRLGISLTMFALDPLQLLQLGLQEHLQQPGELLSSSPGDGSKLDFSSVLALNLANPSKKGGKFHIGVGDRVIFHKKNKIK